MAESLDPSTLPLQGSRLIEASAGTGKTWTIAALYLRLVVGHGCEPRSPAEILVMTFTKAATRELSDRIRCRLVEAAAAFRGERAANDDAVVQALLAAFPAGAERQQAAWRLATAADAMDDAAVWTIDAWCQRMLREHAFDSGCLFDEELQADETAMLAEAVRDYWRLQVYPLGDAALEVVLAQWPDCAALGADMRMLVGRPLPAGAGQGCLADAVASAVHDRAEALAALKAGWVARAEEMQRWLALQWRRKDCPIDKRQLGEANGTRWLGELKDWAADAAAETLDLGRGEQRLTRQGIADSLKPGLTVDVPEVFAAFEALVSALKSLPEPGPVLRVHAAAQVGERIGQLKSRAGTFGFADMQERLAAALEPAARGAAALRLRERIVGQYPVALVDEFQDTSPVQWRILDRLYRAAADDPARLLLLIGDPKQAIYGFRGADIYSYLEARAATAGRHHVLATNYRSTEALVRAQNAIFGRAESRPGDGAFLFGRTGTEPSLPFVEVRANGRPERFVSSAGQVAAVTLVADGEERHKEEARDLYAALCAERIVALLDDPQAGFVEDGADFRRLRPDDIAVLVRTGTEADAVRREMRRRGLASVYLSDKDSVFETAEAADLLRLVQAVASPRDPRLARAALATSLFGSTLGELVALASDDERFDRQCERLQQLHEVWRAQGVLAMLRRALHAFDLPARWLNPAEGAADGERRLTNVLHLAELLQAASARIDGEHALVRWFATQIAGTAPPDGGDERVLRLESDAELVRVVTIHKSKGLEYPLVFVPFAADFRPAVRRGGRAQDRALLLPVFDGARVGRKLVLTPSAVELAAAEKERLREDLRLLYVALTRARHASWIGVAGLLEGRGGTPSWQRSAIGYLVSGPEDAAAAASSGEAAGSPGAKGRRIADLRALAAACSDVLVDELPAVEGPPWPAVTPLRRRASARALLPPRVYAAAFERDWAVGSYSALVRDAARETAGAGAVPARTMRDDEPEAGSAPATGPAPVGAAPVAGGAAEPPWHRFPRGAAAGNFLHEQLEWLADEGFALAGSAELQRALVRRLERRGFGQQAADVSTWLARVCATPLPPVGVALTALAGLAPEMEFWLASERIDARRIDALCRRHLLPGRDRPRLPERALKGMLLGFADLVFEHAGRYWVLDYKSNVLGARDADYTIDAMDAAILEHRYDVQAALYLLALHRLLRARLRSAYEPRRHLGGAIYLFLRGIAGANAGCRQLEAPAALLDELDAMLCDGDGDTGRDGRPQGECAGTGGGR